MSVPRGPGSGIPGDGKPSLAVTGVSPRKGKDRDGVGKGTDASYHRRNTTPDTVLDPPRASAGLEDFPEDPVVEAADESEEEDEGYQGSEHSSTSRFATSEIAAVLVPDPIIPGLVRGTCRDSGWKVRATAPAAGDRGSGWRNKYPHHSSCRRSSPGQTRRWFSGWRPRRRIERQV